MLDVSTGSNVRNVSTVSNVIYKSYLIAHPFQLLSWISRLSTGYSVSNSSKVLNINNVKTVSNASNGRCLTNAYYSRSSSNE